LPPSVGDELPEILYQGFRCFWLWGKLTHECSILIKSLRRLGSGPSVCRGYHLAYLIAWPFHILPPGYALISQSQIVVHRDLDILFGTEISLGGLDGRVPQQKLDLFQIPAILAAELGAGAAEIVGAEVLDADLLR
jgi:hypothetical protein